MRLNSLGPLGFFTTLHNTFLLVQIARAEIMFEDGRSLLEIFYLTSFARSSGLISPAYFSKRCGVSMERTHSVGNEVKGSFIYLRDKITF